ncbi:PREDICTED: uncharacterized protein LOC109335817 [Lupinus angustifolius]|uniref:uncharacterized protein LOC109335817 n=1 Tax=Lupinus angustifolius TaxID=3871 RepID=UPI00092FD3B4|nr:PREDICTED: uncharacterized protein LOC109335817 [Lupinus angustifolius]
MNRPLMNEEEEEVHDRKLTFYLCHPCFFLEETFKGFLRCLGVETSSGRSSRTKGSMKKKEYERSLLKKVSDNADVDSVTTSQNYANNSHKTNQVIANPPSSTMTQINDVIAMEKGGPRKPPLSQGNPPQHN